LVVHNKPSSLNKKRIRRSSHLNNRCSNQVS